MCRKLLFSICVSVFLYSCESSQPDIDFYRNELITIQSSVKNKSYCYNKQSEHKMLLRIEHLHYLKNKEKYDAFFESYRIMSKKQKVSAIVYHLCTINEHFQREVSEIDKKIITDYLERSLPTISEMCINY